VRGWLRGERSEQNKKLPEGLYLLYSALAAEVAGLAGYMDVRICWRFPLQALLHYDGSGGERGGETYTH
jgi:hypothetical protein